ncbi:MAG: hypothetical protein V4665_01795 [Patescibacteria group bacterium]
MILFFIVLPLAIFAWLIRVSLMHKRKTQLEKILIRLLFGILIFIILVVGIFLWMEATATNSDLESLFPTQADNADLS